MKRLITKYLRAEFFMPEILVPLMGLTLNCVLLLFAINRYLYNVVNLYFVLQLLYILFVVMLYLIISHIIFFTFSHIIKGKELRFKRNGWKFHRSDLIFILLPLSSIVEYLIINLDLLTYIEAIKVLIFYLLFSFINIYIFPLIIGKFGEKWTMLSAGTAFAFIITIMPNLSQEFNWITEGNFAIQVLIFGFVFLLIRFLTNQKTRKFLYIIILINFLAAIITPFIIKDVSFAEADSMSPEKDSKLISYVDGKKVSFTPNIYLLAYESYVPYETMIGYGIDNHQQEDFLKDQGFVIYPDIYSIGSPTAPSMSRVFNASTSYFGYIRRGISGDGVVHNIFRNIGYQTIGVFPDNFMFQGVGSNYDYSFPEVREENLTSDKLLILTILSGEFRFKLGLRDLPPSYDQYLEVKQNIFEELHKNPIFVYSHSNFPGHAGFQTECRPNEIDLYREDLKKANLEMQYDVNKIIENDNKAIIIVAGDHGPYLMNDCWKTLKDISEVSRLDIQDRFATFLAIRWPDEEYEKYDNFVVLQDLFPVIFSYIYADDKLLETKIDPVILSTEKLFGASVVNGIIKGGINDSEPLFILDSQLNQK